MSRNAREGVRDAAAVTVVAAKNRVEVTEGWTMENENVIKWTYCVTYTSYDFRRGETVENAVWFRPFIEELLDFKQVEELFKLEHPERSVSRVEPWIVGQ